MTKASPEQVRRETVRSYWSEALPPSLREALRAARLAILQRQQTISRNSFIEGAEVMVR